MPVNVSIATADDIDALRNELAELRALIKTLLTSRQSTSPSASTSQSTSPSGSSSRSTSPSASVSPSPAAVMMPVSSQTHAYFEALRARPEHWKSYSLRDAAQVQQYLHGNGTNVSYNPAADTYRAPQDAVKLSIPTFKHYGVTLGEDLSATETSLVALKSASGGGLATNPQITYQIDDEVLIWRAKEENGRVGVTRGAHGTIPAPHRAGTSIALGSNSLLPQVRLPMGTEDGHSYLTTWDAWYGQEIHPSRTGLTNWKTFQFARVKTATSPLHDSVLGLEVRTRFARKGLTLGPNDIGDVDMRAYLTLGPDTTNEPIAPMTGQFIIRADTWTRYWALIEHRVGDWDRLSLWIADETRDAVQILRDVPFDASPARFGQFWLEFNTSTDAVRPSRGTLVAYVRNVVMLRDVVAPTTLFQRPRR